MSVATTYRKVSGKASRVSIWIITQLKDPVKLFMPVPKGSQFRAGYNEQSEKLPASLDVRDGILSCTRSRKDSTKIGSDGSRLIWAGEKEILELISPREENGEFPDNGSSAEIYTNPDPNAYIELELLGPLHTLTAGQSVSRKQQYRLHRRSADALETQVRDLRE